MELTNLIIYIISGIFSIIIMYFLFRFIFSVDKKIKQNEEIIGLLKLIAKKQGASKEEIEDAKFL